MLLLLPPCIVVVRVDTGRPSSSSSFTSFIALVSIVVNTIISKMANEGQRNAVSTSLSSSSSTADNDTSNCAAADAMPQADHATDGSQAITIDPFHLRIKTNNNDLQLQVQSSDTIAYMKKQILQRLQLEPSRYIRLVCHGRLLAPDNTTVRSHTVLQPDTVVHAVIAAAGQTGGAQAVLQQQQEQLQNNNSSSMRRLFSPRELQGTGIGHDGRLLRPSGNQEDDDEDSSSSFSSDREGEEDDSLIVSTDEDDIERGTTTATTTTQTNQGRRRRRRDDRHLGFDRLRLALNLRRSQIQVIRSYFSRQVDDWVRGLPSSRLQQLEGSETDPMRRRYIHEEAWMLAQGPSSEFRLNVGSMTAGNSNNPWNIAAGANPSALWRASALTNHASVSTQTGTDRDFLWGFMLGFFVGFIMLVWVWMPTVPHKQKLGILSGISVQLAFTMLNNNHHGIEEYEYGVDGQEQEHHPFAGGQHFDDILGGE